MTQPVVLLIEDDPSITGILAAFLIDEGYRCLTAHSTGEGWLLLQQERPALILLDVHLEARESGWALLQRLRASPGVSDVPVLLISADSYFLKAQAQAIRDYGLVVLHKPFDLNQLIQAMQQALMH